MQTAHPTPEACAGIELQARPVAGLINGPIEECAPGYQGMGQQGDILSMQNGSDFQGINSPADLSADIEREFPRLRAAAALHPWSYPHTHVGKNDEKTRF